MADWLTNWGKDVMWKRRQRTGKGRHWPKHFIISDYSIEVKWLTDWPTEAKMLCGKGGKLKVKGGADPNQLCKSSWYMEKEANWSQGRSWPKPIMQVILVPGKGGKLKVKGGADLNQLCKSSWYLEKEASSLAEASEASSLAEALDIDNDWPMLIYWLTKYWLTDNRLTDCWLTDWLSIDWLTFDWLTIINLDNIYSDWPILTLTDEYWP